MDMQSLILLVDDDAGLRRLIGDFLVGHGYRVLAVENVESMRRTLATAQPDLLIIDVMMPGEDGLSAARELAAANGPPVIILSALGSDTDRIVGLEVGADDYLAKPCNLRELLARVRALLRRRATLDAQRDATRESGRGAFVGTANAMAQGDRHSARPFAFAGWRLDVLRRDLRDPAGVLIELSDGEFSLLRAFVEHPQRVLTRDQLIELVRGGASEVFDRAVDSQISRLRRKLHARGDVELIRTVRNEGYMLLPSVSRV